VRLAALLLLPLFATAPAMAQSGVQTFGLDGGNNSGKPLEILADHGIEWHQNEQIYVARGNAKATRGNVTVYADTLTAHYRPLKQGEAAQGQQVGGNTEIYRVVADGNVRLETDTQTVYGDHGVYDVDTATIVVTGNNLRLVTPRDEVTARDSLEWFDQRQLAVARGDAVAIRDEKRVRADVLVAQVVKQDDGSSHISRVDANGSVLVSTPEEVAQGAAGVYNADTGIVTLERNVTVTRGDNTLKGEYAVVDLNTNVSRMLPGPPQAGAPQRVQGIVVPRSKPDAGKPDGSKSEARK
jgi:lipopolysaccharide export system protein LptA